MSELDKIIAALRSRPTPPDATWNQRRRAMEAMQVALPIPDDVQCRRIDAAGVRAEWIEVPGSNASRTLLYLHGGGYALGSVTTHRHLMQRIARATRTRVLALDYRLAPEHPFPAAVDDAVAGYRYLLSQGLSAESIALGGDSAGGGLAMALMLSARDQELDLPSCAFCLSPWADLSLSGDSITSRAAEDPMITNAGLAEFAQAYLGSSDARHPLASPVFADLSGLPPLLLQVGSAEVLLDDAIRLAERARQAGIDADLEVWDSMIHVFHAFPSLEESDRAISAIARFVECHLASAPVSTG